MKPFQKRVLSKEGPFRRRSFPKNEFLHCLPVNRCSCQLIAWVFQYAPRSAAGATYRRVRQSLGLWLGPKGTATRRSICVRHSVSYKTTGANICRFVDYQQFYNSTKICTILSVILLWLCLLILKQFPNRCLSLVLKPPRTNSRTS